MPCGSCKKRCFGGTYCLYHQGFLSHHQIAGKNWDIKIANRSFDKVSQFKYLGMPVVSMDLIWEEIERRLNCRNVCYHLIQYLLSSCLLSKNVKIWIYKPIISPLVLWGYETWSLALREEHRLKVRFEVFTAVTMKNGVFWVVMPCGSCKNRRSEEPGASFTHHPSTEAWDLALSRAI
jgi:hypothetical protein